MSTKLCACKGIRTCLLCDSTTTKRNDHLPEQRSLEEYIYCWQCGDRAYRESSFETHLQRHNNGTALDQFEMDTEALPIDGVFLQEEAITQEEELKLVESIDSFDWVQSQSGRRKQDFGPKINFKKKKVNFTLFNGLPQLDMRLLGRIKEHRLRDDANYCKFDRNIDNSVLKKDSSQSILRNFKTVEVCHLEYCPERGSSIDPHFDDFWIWGERLVTLNLLSSTVITLTPKRSDNGNAIASENHYCIRVHLPARSLLVLYGDARYLYEHSIRRTDITSRRLAITYRELPPSFLDSNQEDYARIGKAFIERAEQFIDG